MLLVILTPMCGTDWTEYTSHTKTPGHCLRQLKDEEVSEMIMLRLCHIMLVVCVTEIGLVGPRVIETENRSESMITSVASVTWTDSCEL